MNKLTIIGNLTAAPELRYTATGLAICGFTVAVNRKKTANNEDPGADFFRVTAFRQLGENCAKFLDKGRKVCVVGPVELREWEKDGKTFKNMDVTAEDVEFLSPRISDNTEPAKAAASAPAVPAGFSAVESDELPF